MRGSRALLVLRSGVRVCNLLSRRLLGVRGLTVRRNIVGLKGMFGEAFGGVRRVSNGCRLISGLGKTYNASTCTVSPRTTGLCLGGVGSFFRPMSSFVSGR